MGVANVINPMVFGGGDNFKEQFIYSHAWSSVEGLQHTETVINSKMEIYSFHNKSNTNINGKSEFFEFGVAGGNNAWIKAKKDGKYRKIVTPRSGNVTDETKEYKQGDYIVQNFGGSAYHSLDVVNCFALMGGGNQ